MRELFKFVLILSLAAAISCSSSIRSNSQADADLPESGDDYPVTEGHETENNSEEYNLSSQEQDESDSLSSSVTDEEAIYQLSLAEEYYTFGVAANLKKNWAEAQYNFETAIELLSALSLDGDSSESEPSALEKNYKRLMNEITSDYKLTLFNLSVLSDDVSPYAIDEKFRLLDSLSGFAKDTIVTTSRGPEKITYDMPIVLNDRVTKWIIYFQTSARKFTEQTLARSSMYVPIMEKILQEEGLPHDLVYLPFIESGYKDRAYSWAHAAGFWQFISSTGRMWGLKRNWWYDERYDFEKATRAAAKYLKSLYEEFGDWRLALTAYNGGAGNVNKMKRSKQNKGKDYWDWKIRNSQMRNFVPKYMAATIIAKDPERYGFTRHAPQPLTWELVTIDRAIYLKDIAAASGVSVKKIKELNPAVLRDYTPPDMKDFKLRLPIGKSGMFLASYDDMKSPKETSWVKHRISRGETVSTIARKYGVSQSAIIQANNMHRPYRIIAGKTLMVPVPLDRSSGYANVNRTYDLTGQYYIVRPGDNLSNIASAFGTTPEKIASYNNLTSKNRINVGQKLSIPGHSSGQDSDGDYFVHSVKKGETLSKLATKYSTTISKICRLNSMSSRTILLIGQKIKIPGQKPTQTYAASPSESFDNTAYHTVKKGQNLTIIASQYGTTVPELCRLNGISKWSTLAVGQKLKVPGTAVAQVQQNLSKPDSEKIEYIVHKVRRGHNLSYISKKYGTTIEEICRLNGISRNSTLRIGQTLKVPFYGNDKSDDYVIYVVRRGDTIWDIARTFATSTDEILSLNSHINPYKLRVGDKLKIRAN
jgi:membrane-bound lytic murein transglycosylase D